MRKADIIPGLAVACPAGNINSKTIKAGAYAVPGVVLAFGKYRLSQQGACSKVAAPALSGGTDVAVVLRKAGYFWNYSYSKDNRPEDIAPDTEWELAIVSPYKIIPWADYEVLRAEYAQAEIDVAAARADMERAKTNIRLALMNIERKSLAKLVADAKIHVNGATSQHEVTFNVTVPFEALPDAVRQEVLRQEAAYAAASKRATCEVKW